MGSDHGTAELSLTLQEVLLKQTAAALPLVVPAALGEAPSDGGDAAREIPLVQVAGPDPLADLDPDAECPICLCPCEETCRAACGHAFCADCISGALRSGRTPWRGRCPLCRGRVSAYTLKQDDTGEPLLKPDQEVTTIFGQTYIQNDTSGVASFHFVSEAEAYISYESAGCVALPALDDGGRPPDRKPFENASYDERTRTFRGTVHWASASWLGDARWEYEMVFADDFMSVVGGQLKAFASGSTTPCRIQRFAEDQKDNELCYSRLVPASSPFGHAYMQLGLLGLASYHFTGEREGYISYEAPEALMLPALDDGGRPPARKDFSDVSYDPETRTLRAAVSWAPASWHGVQRWEYDMVFSEDFMNISEGEVRQFAAGGAEVPSDVVKYGATLLYTRCHPGTLAFSCMD